ncbi:Hypothetical predicted protein [Lecanosticta acicola]|uniref:Uncharacterized protein n=1 Tax=Lecanosticta acicola TaxID=111012 RepID=A0AAI8YRD1_9PEZI|nr:Hypothetical predicted protein [Lecanosticta acicola]
MAQKRNNNKWARPRKPMQAATSANRFNRNTAMAQVRNTAHCTLHEHKQHSHAKHLQQPFRFLDLAPELRNRIYDYALVLDPKDSQPVHKKLKQPGLLTTCTQIRAEARMMWYSQNDFVIIVQDCNANLLQRWLQHVSALPDTFEFSLAIIPKGRYDWHNLLDWCKMVHERKIENPFFTEEDDSRLKNWVADDRYDSIISQVTNIAHDCRDISWQRCWRKLEALRKTELSTSMWSEFNDVRGLRGFLRPPTRIER